MRNKKPRREYWSWNAMKRRCYVPTEKRFERYGGRGITVCDRWRDSFSNFLEDMGPRPIGMTLDRINNDGNYEPGNCRWATHGEQAENKSKRSDSRFLDFGGKHLTLTEWAAEIGMNRRTLMSRLRKGWSVDVALTKPVRSW